MRTRAEWTGIPNANEIRTAFPDHFERLELMRFPKILIPLALAGVLVACGKETKSTGRSGGRDPFRFGVSPDANGTVTLETDVIPAGSAAAMSFYVLPPGIQVRTVWKDLASNAEAVEQVKTTGSRGFVAFQQSLPEGSYRVDIFSKPPEAKQWQNGGSHSFRVGKKS
jgi:hypothetical protein